MTVFIMLLSLLLSDVYSGTLERAPNPTSMTILGSPAVTLDADAGMMLREGISPTHQIQRQITAGNDESAVQQHLGLRTEYMQRLQDDEARVSYTLLCEWSMQLVWLLLSGLALCLPLLYEKHAFRDRFGQLTSRFWNPKHLQYRFCHTAS
jgi:hypothetical protein